MEDFNAETNEEKAKGNILDTGNSDLEAGSDKLHGSIGDRNYAGLARLMSEDPDVLIIRQFAHLNARNLLYYQSELMAYEKKLAIEEYRLKANGITSWLVSWSAVNAAAADQNADAIAYRTLINDLRSTLYQYNKILKQQQFLSNLPQPSSYDLKLLRSWINFGFGNDQKFLTGDDKTAYDYKNEEDLVFTGPKKNFDPFTDNFIKKGTLVWNRLKQMFSGSYNNFHSYNERWVVKVISVGATIIACMLPVASIIVLHQLPANPAWQRLLTLASFTFIFVVTMIFFTKAQRSDVFAAAAAFAAVQVLFIGTNNEDAQSILLPSSGVNVTISPLNNSLPA